MSWPVVEELFTFDLSHFTRKKDGGVQLRLLDAVMDGDIACKLCQRWRRAPPRRRTEGRTCTIYIRMGFQIEKCGRSFFDSFAGGRAVVRRHVQKESALNAILACFLCAYVV